MFDPETQAFLHSGCGLLVATVSRDGEPHATRGWGLDIVELGPPTVVRVLLDADDERTLEHAAAGGAMAITAANVLTLRSLQLKGRSQGLDAAELGRAGRPLRPRLPPRCRARRPRHLGDLQLVLPPTYVACMVSVAEMFDQTPGPGAGARTGRADGRGRGAHARRARCRSWSAASVAPSRPSSPPPPVTARPTSPICLGCTGSTTSGWRCRTSSSPRRCRTWPRTRGRACCCWTPSTYDQYRLSITYERTERRGPVFERLRGDVEALAALGGMMEVFKLRAADIYRVLSIELVPSAARPAADYQPPEADAGTVDAERAGGARLPTGARR